MRRKLSVIWVWRNSGNRPEKNQPAFADHANRPNHTSAYARRSAERDPLTCDSTSPEAPPVRRQKLSNGQSLPDKSTDLLGDIAVDALVFEFIGLAMIALCIIVLAVPSQRRPSGRVRHY